MADKMLKIELKKSLIGRGAKQIATAEALAAETGSLAIAGANAAALAGHSLVCTGNSVQFMKFHYAYTPCY